MDGVVVGWLLGRWTGQIFEIDTQEEVSTGAAARALVILVGSVRGYVQYLAAARVTNDDVRVGCCAVHQVVEELTGGCRVFGLDSSKFSCGGDHGRIGVYPV